MGYFLSLFIHGMNNISGSDFYGIVAPKDQDFLASIIDYVTVSEKILIRCSLKSSDRKWNYVLKQKMFADQVVLNLNGYHI